MSTVERQKIKQYNSVSARSLLPSHRMKTLQGDSITRIGGKTGGGGRWEKTGAPPPSAPSLEPRLVALTKLPEKTLCRYNSFELIYSSLFTKYGRQLNRKNRMNTATEKIQGQLHINIQKLRQMLGNKTSIINKTVSNHNDHAIN